MIVVHSTEVSILYPRVVISSLAEQLENLLFAILSIPLVYGSEITTCCYKGLLYELVMLCCSFLQPWVPNCSAKASSWLEPLLHLVDQITFCVLPHTSEKDSQHTISLISKQVISYQTRGGTCCPRVSTPKTWSLAYSSMTSHITWRIPTVSTIPTNAQTTASILATVTSHHDGWKTKTLNSNTRQTQHHKDGKTCTTLMSVWLCITNQVWTHILKVWCLVNSLKACRPMCILERESI
jgi:hypothetical protein